jgi:hypothetical protein
LAAVGSDRWSANPLLDAGRTRLLQWCKQQVADVVVTGKRPGTVDG